MPSRPPHRVRPLHAAPAAAPLLALILALALAACSGGSGKPPDSPPAKGVSQVAAKHLKFTPPVIEVPAGTTVTWKFEDGGVPHDVKGDGWSSGSPRRAGTFTHRFDTPGTNDYRCTLHPGMTGRVIVTG